MSMLLFLLPGIVPSRSEMVSGRVSDGAGVGRIAWYTRAGDPWYTLADDPWYIITRLMTRYDQPGRRKLMAWPDIVIVQVVKHRTAAGLDIVRRIVQGGETLVARLLHTSQGGGVINTAYIERLNATFCQRLACLARRTRRCLVQDKATLTAGMYVVGFSYNLCDEHESMRKPLWITERRKHWVQRTPAMAAGLTDHCWTPTELFAFKVPPATLDSTTSARQTIQTDSGAHRKVVFITPRLSAVVRHPEL